jgi:hypothetical protein
MVLRGRLVWPAFLTILLFCFEATTPAAAACGIDVLCAISQSVGSGAGKGFADSVRPLVTEVMEREAPALIGQLQAGRRSQHYDR